MTTSTLGQQVRAKREADGLSRASLAYKLGFTQSYILSVENGKKHPTKEDAQVLMAYAYGRLDKPRPEVGDWVKDFDVYGGQCEGTVTAVLSKTYVIEVDLGDRHLCYLDRPFNRVLKSVLEKYCFSTQRELADALGIPRGWITQTNAGKTQQLGAESAIRYLDSQVPSTYNLAEASKIAHMRTKYMPKAHMGVLKG